MTKSQAEAEPKARASCLYRALTALCIRASGQWIPKGKIADLSDCTDESIRILLEKGYIETAEGEPFNKPTGKVDRPPCPCKKE